MKTLQTNHPPLKPLMLWDGKCGFCHWWIIRWKLITDDNVDFEKFQDALSRFPDIPEKTFEEAVRLIETDGMVYGGAHAVYRSFTYGKRRKWLYFLYKRSKTFARLSESVYHWISGHRSLMYNVTVTLLGKNPMDTKPYWFLYLCLIVFLSGVLNHSLWD
ncbi:MAG: DCC1-like thiol-disulfide oxidoreductase family protein [Balneolales bacterium]